MTTGTNGVVTASGVVAVPGSGSGSGNVASVTAGDSTITIGGTATNPTVAVNAAGVATSVTAADGSVVITPNVGAVTVRAVPQSATPYFPNMVLNGGGVAWTGLLNFTVSPASYVIGNTPYSSILTNLTLATADPALDRIDIIALNSSNAAVVITGTPAASPAAPNTDDATQLPLTFVYVAAAATTPSNITNTIIYAENVEWTTTSSGASINVASTNNPHGGTKSIEGTAVASGDYARFVNSGTIDLASYNNLVFWIAPKASWNQNRSFTLQWSNAGVNRGLAVVFRENTFGFVSSNTAYQQIVIPLSTFQANGLAVDRLQVTMAGSGGTMGFYLDDFSLQAGLNTVTQQFLRWRGAYNSAFQYVANDVFSYLGSTFVVLKPISGSTPTIANANYQLLTPQPVTQTVAYAASISVNLDNYPYSPVKLTTTLTGNANVTFTGGFVGQVVMWEFVQDGTGSRTWTPNAVIKFSTSLPTFALSTAAAAADHISFYVKTAGSAYRCLANNPGF